MKLQGVEIHTIYDVLDVVRVRPAMWIGQPSPYGLQVFLSGFRSGIHAAGQALARESPPFQGFHAWVAARLGLETNGKGWPMLLLEACGEETAAFDRFWTELDEYRRSAASAG